MRIKVIHDKENHKFLSLVEGKIARLRYTPLPGGKTLDYVSTYVPPELRGRQIAGQIVKAALDYAKENQFKVIPSCSFVHTYIERHPEYNELIIT